MAPKNKGQGEGTVTYQDACGVYNITSKLQVMFMILEDQKLIIGEE